MIEVRGLGKSYGGRVLFSGLDLVFERGRTTVITGRSGSGKSTLLRILNQLERQDEGVLRIGELEIPAGLPHGEWKRRVLQLRRRTGMVFQGYHLFPHLDVIQNVTLAPVRAFGVDRRAAEAKGMELLAAVGMEAAAQRRPARLSGGESQRVAIARALATEPEVLLLDEPTSALDPRSTEDVVQVIEGLRAKGMTLVMVTHQLELARRLGDRVMEMGSATEASE
ncbi:MAG: ATP-binding cassette domain-containing protein [Planctomycetota bacterium]